MQLLRQIVNTGELAHSSITVDKSVRSEVLYDIFIRLGECGINECQIHLNETNISCTFSTGDSGKFPELKSLDKISMSRILDGASSELKFYEKFNTVVVKLSEPLSPIETEKLNLANQNRNPKFMPIVLCDKNVEATLVLKELALIESLSTRPVLFIVKNRGYDYK